MQDQRLLTILWRGKWLVLIGLAVGIGLAVLATKATSKVYQASATIQVNAGNGVAGNSVSPNDLQNAAQSLAQTYATLVTDPSFLEQIRGGILGGRYTTSELSQSLSARAVPNTSLVSLTAQAPSVDRARALAQAVGNAFVRSLQRDAAKRTDALQTQIQQRISQLNAQIASPSANAQTVSSLKAARTELEKQLAALVAGQIAQGASVTLTGPATGPTSAVKPRPVLNLVAGALLGLLVGVLLAWLRTLLDRRLHSAAEAERLLGVPTLAHIPVRRRFSGDDPVLGEAYDVLRANLAFLSYDQDLHVITFTSYNPREGKSSTVEGLAYAAVRGGFGVLIVDADVRTRSLSTRLGHADSPGLTNVVVGMAAVDDTIVELSPGLSLLPAGPLPPNPPSLLSSARMRELIGELRGRHSLVLIDAPPVAHLADASILASMADGVIVVARVGVTNRADLPAAAAHLRQVPTPIVGCVLLEPRQIDDTYYPAVAQGARPMGADEKPEPPREPDIVETF